MPASPDPLSAQRASLAVRYGFEGDNGAVYRVIGPAIAAVPFGFRVDLRYMRGNNGWPLAALGNHDPGPQWHLAVVHLASH